MNELALDTDAYLKRVGLQSQPPVSLAGLCALQCAQARSIPFENFDILLGRGVDISRAAIFKKTLGHARGGYCFELNELLYAALQAFGFGVRRVLARVHLSGEPSALAHQTNLVQLNGQDFLSDAGFGGQTPRTALPYVLDAVTEYEGERYRLVAAAPYGVMLQDWSEGAWRNLYSFEERLVLPVDLMAGNHLTSSHPRSFFTWAPRAALQTAEGRHTLWDNRLTTVRHGKVEERDVPNGPDFIRILKDRFHIGLDVPYEAIKPLHPAPPRRL